MRLVIVALLLAGCSGDLRLGTEGGGTCTSNSECPGGLCDVERGRCMVACQEDLECNAQQFPRGCRDEFGPDRCVACRDSEDCSGQRAICAGGLCVACDADSQCPGSRCDRSQGSCVSD